MSFFRACVAPLCLIAFAFTCLPASVAQSPEVRTVQIERWSSNNPVRAVGVTYRGEQVVPGKPFAADRNWLENVSVILKNETQKRIVGGFIQLDLTLPGNLPADFPLVRQFTYQFTIGRLPERELYTQMAKMSGDRPPAPPLAFLPGEELSVPFAPEYGAIKHTVEIRQAIGTVQVCSVRLVGFYFEDGTSWGLENLRSVNRERQFGPVKVVDMTYRGARVTPFMPFAAGDDWLKDVSITLKNDTQKKIIAAVIHLDFPDTDSAGHGRMGHQFRLGQLPEHALYNRMGKKLTDLPREPLAFLPGEEISISLAPEYAAIKGFVESRLPISTVQVCWVRLLVFYFADGTVWDSSHYARPDPANPGKYVPITVEEFQKGTSQ